MPLLFATTIFVSAFLLFLIQPLIAKQILPWFGGSAGVWATCLVFFQAAWMAGYLYAHALVRYLAPRSQALLHIGLLAASCLALPVIADSSWKPRGGDDPVIQIIGLLALTVGLPYFLLSSTGPLMQAWYARCLARVPWRLFALSNLGSLLALLAYPFAVEPWVTTLSQAWIWSGAYAVFATLCATAAWRAGRHAAAAPQIPAVEDAGPPPGAATRVLWLLFAATGSALLLAVSNHITQNVASVPFLWILPLSLYLLSFILCFERERAYHRGLFLVLAALTIPAMGWLLDALELKLVIPACLLGLFILCMFCHGELARLKPAPRHLTSFYLSLSAGGVLGGLAIGVGAPLLLSAYYELGIVLACCALLALFVSRRMRPWFPAVFTYVLIAAAWFSYGQISAAHAPGVVAATRNFYGAICVRDYGPPAYIRTFRHGPILHGGQLLGTPEARRKPRTYYGPDSGLGQVIEVLRARGPLHIGVVGLGVGTIAAWGRAGDRIRFYELDPAVIAMARREFSYLQDSAAEVTTVPGDARLSLEREQVQQFDLLSIDAFSADSIPVHLLTIEALDIYLGHLKPGGVLLYHATNRYLDIAPVVKQLAAQRGMQTALLRSDGGKAATANFENASDWIIASTDRAVVEAPALANLRERIAAQAGLALWTDDYNNLLQILR
jgi:hypothetical protein